MIGLATCDICKTDTNIHRKFIKLVKLISKLEKNPKDKVVRKAYEKVYKQAVKDNDCGGYCSNPYVCTGGCYEY